MPGLHVKFDITPEEFVGHLTEAAYRVALKRGFKGSFLDLQRELYQALHDVVGEDMFVTDICGLYTVCQEAVPLPPWSPEAEASFREASP